MLTNRTLAVWLATGMALLSQCAVAATPEFQVTPRAGLGSLRVDALVGVNEERVNADTTESGPASAT